MAHRFCIAVSFSLFVLTGCNNDGLFGHSKTKEEAKANGSTITEYIPNKSSFLLLDGTKMQMDNAWTEMSFTYKDGKRILDTTYGYHFSIPFKKEVAGNFTFSLSLVDTTNRMFTNGMSENIAQLCPKHLYDKMEVILEQKNPDTSFGWLKPIITDTLVFTKVK